MSNSIMTATEVIGLVIEKRRKMVSCFIALVAHVADAKKPVIDRLALFLDQ